MARSSWNHGADRNFVLKPLLHIIVATYVLAPLPNAIFSRCAGRDDLMSDYQGGFADAGYFLTGLMIVTGFCLPVVLAHAKVVRL